MSDSREPRSYRAKAEFMRHHPRPSTGKVKVRDGCKGYVIDHIDPLACGGTPAYNIASELKKIREQLEKAFYTGNGRFGVDVFNAADRKEEQEENRREREEFIAQATSLLNGDKNPK